MSRIEWCHDYKGLWFSGTLDFSWDSYCVDSGQGSPGITVIQVYAPTTNAEKTEVEWFYEDLQELLELTPKKNFFLGPLHHRGLECKSRKSRDTWSIGKFGPGVQNEAGQRITEFCPENEHTGHSKHPLPTTQEKTLHMDITNGQYQNQTDYILCSQRWTGSIQSAKTRLGAECGSGHELLIVKLSLKLEKVGKTTRPFRSTWWTW